MESPNKNQLINAVSVRRMRRRSRREQKRRSSEILVAGLVILLFAGIGYLVFFVPPSTNDNATIGRARVGDVAQDFRLPTADGRSISLSAYKGYPVLLFFSEGVGCDPCWRQIVELQNSPELAGLKVSIIAVTVDPVDSLQPIVEQWGIKVPVVSDTSKKTASTYDTMNVGSMHPGEKPGHTFILVGEDGVIKWRYDLPQSEADSGRMYVPTEEVAKAIQEVLLGS